MLAYDCTAVSARKPYNLCSLLNTSLASFQLNPLAWIWAAQNGLYWACIILACVFWAIRLLESKDRSYAELNLFESRVPAWKFKSTMAHEFRAKSMKVESLREDSEGTMADDMPTAKHVKKLGQKAGVAPV